MQKFIDFFEGLFEVRVRRLYGSCWYIGFHRILSQYISPEGAVFIISMIPLFGTQGGLLAASLLKISAAKAIPLCVVGNIIPIPFILVVYQTDFQGFKKTKLFRGTCYEIGRQGNGEKVIR